MATKTPEEWLKEPYTRIIVPSEDGTFTAEMLEFPGCIAQGDSGNEALRNLEKTAKAWIEATLEEGRDVPHPCSGYDYSGKIALRIPSSIHRQAALIAEREGTSLNQYFLAAIASMNGASDMYNRIAQRVQRLYAQYNMTIGAVNVVFAVNQDWVKGSPALTAGEVSKLPTVTTSGDAGNTAQIGTKVFAGGIYHGRD